MRQAHEVAKVRAAEGDLMATLPEGALMQRAAFGLVSVCAGLLEQPYGARVVVLAGSGDNGGDALYAGALLACRGAAVHAINTGPGACVQAASTTGRGGSFSGKPAQIQLIPGTAASHPKSGKAGDLYVDKTARLWFCKTAGNPATWVQVV